jgi:uncharacterized membrane protein YdbT with pleckstrin-like domain
MSTDTEETTLWRGAPSQWTNAGTYLFCVLLTAGIVYGKTVYTGPYAEYFLALLIIPIFWALSRWIGTSTHRYEVTSERIKLTTGLLSKQTTELELYRVRDYSVVEPFWLRLVGCGNIVLVSADRTSPQVVLRAVPRAATLKDQIRMHTERMRQRRGVRDLEIDPPTAPPN